MTIYPLESLDPHALNVLQRVLLIADGTVTKILEAYAEEPIQVIKISEEVVVNNEYHPALQISSDQPLRILQRKILLQTQFSQINQLYAESLIVLDRLDKQVCDALMYGSHPIGQVLQDHNIDTYRHICQMGRERNSQSLGYFNLPQDFHMISRSYVISSKKMPIMFITEKFPENHFLY